MKSWRYFTALTAASLALASTGCSGSADRGDPTETPTVTATATRKPATTPSPEQELEIPAGVTLVVKPFRHTGDHTLSFRPRTDVFSLRFLCTGGGQVRVSLTAGKPADAKPCDGAILRATYAIGSRGSRQTLRVDAEPDATWRLAVAEGDALGPKVDQ
ncbi:hypothetical protein SAMN05421678_12743 [Actinopolymorpha cephalotaxi]|uniref:Lipoprotein n=1 Tax=Actinopolymorpha cephalotaxi TaxID=504797 RepID=A0A1I3BWU4_9ACTN|nr:hypothetical protein [Actinopolymorpha cephalotaxi]NYH86331.1 hypothetical protein [Actinopolymorpha cephalotaxi]SFH66785.1 hypothetical protein SAMN05421678_12743 [Actinopolymorpha cephalotaxi]